MLTKEQKILFLTLLNTDKEKLTQKFQTSADGKKAKDEVWEKIFEKMKARGYTGTTDALRDNEFQN